jgi:hypothetical protein
MSGVGKKTTLHNHLRMIAKIRNVPFLIQIKSGAAELNTEEEGQEPEPMQMTYETSHIHMGFDIARMSMQDKQKLRPILSNLGPGSQVMSGIQGRGARIIVLYHAHLLSSESILLIQTCLEQNEGDVSIWMTSELPVPIRIRDWFIELPCEGEDHALQTFMKISNIKEVPIATWNGIFTNLITKWIHSPPPKIGDIEKVKAFVYELLMRNLRWVEVAHYLLDAIILHPDLNDQQRLACMKILAKCEATGSGYTIPSYRIPIIWESLFIHLRTILYSTE